MYIEPIYLLTAGLCFCAFMMGRSWSQWTSSQAIVATIEHLIDEGYLRAYVNADGETELIKIRDERNSNGWSRTSTDD